MYIICTFEQWYLELNTGQRLSEYYDQMIKWNEIEPDYGRNMQEYFLSFIEWGKPAK